MALSMKNANANAQKEEESKKVEAKEEAQKVEAAVTATTPQYEDGVLCSKSDTVAFVCPLGDPSHLDVTTDKKTGTKNTTPYIVGYRFKALVDMEVPDCGLAEDARKNLMSYKDINGKKLVKAGETFDLTRFETALLFAPAEFNGKISGEGKVFTIQYMSNDLKGKNGKLGSTSAAAEFPTASIKAEKGSLKDYEIVPVLSFTYEDKGNGVRRKIRTIIKGFEKWEPLCIAATAKREGSGSSASSSKTSRNAKAEAFLQLVNKRKQQ